MQTIDLRSVSVSLLFLLSFLLISLQVDQQEFVYFISLYGLSFAAYIILIRQRNITSRTYLVLAVAAHLTFLFSTPALSEDFYRFLWDGELINAGINPYDFTPNELMNTSRFMNDSYFTELYSGISDLSKENYTCYPILNQLYFAIAGFLTDSVMINLVILRLLFFLTYAFCYFYLLKLFRFLELSEDRVWILFLNPLWIIETMGNLHFEGVMVSFMIVGSYFLLQRKLINGSVMLAAAIQIKLIPILMLPFFFRYLGILKASLSYFLVMLMVLGSAMILLNNSNIHHFAESLLLYFSAFEFNSFIFHYYLEYGHWRYGWYLNETISLELSRISVFFIALFSLYGDIRDGEVLFKRFVLAYTIYLIFSTTVHPWYILPLFTFSLFTEFGYPMLWTLLISLSYSGYVSTFKENGTYELLVGVEYITLLSLFIFEVIRKRSLLSDFFRERDHFGSLRSGTGS